MAGRRPRAHAVGWPDRGRGFAVLAAVGLSLAGLALQCSVGCPVGLVESFLVMGLGWERGSLTLNPLVLAATNVFSLGVVLLVGTWLARRSFSAMVPMRRFPPAVLLPVLLTSVGGHIVLLQSAAGLEALLPVPEFFDTFFSEVLGGERSVLGSAVLVVLVAPVTEEVVFRGMLLRGLSVRLGAGGAVFVSALLFALFHANPWQLGPSFLLGLLYGWWTVRTGSLWPAILGHALNNATGTLMFSILPGIEGSEALLEAADGTTAPWLAVLAALGLLVGLSGCVLLLRRDPPDRVADHLGGEAAARG